MPTLSIISEIFKEYHRWTPRTPIKDTIVLEFAICFKSKSFSIVLLSVLALAIGGNLYFPVPVAVAKSKLKSNLNLLISIFGS